MTNHPHRSQTARTLAQAAGYCIREGSYVGTTDDRLGRWYFGHDDDNGFRLYGAGHRTQRDAWEAAVEHGREIGLITFAADLKAWIRRVGYTRDGAAAALAVPRSTLDGWCAGRPPALEGSLRRLMELIEAH